MRALKPFSMLAILALLTFVPGSKAADHAGRHLTADAARDIAVRAAKQRGLSLSDFDPPTVEFEGKYHVWHVTFHGKSRRIADWCDVVVDDLTSEAEFHWGK